MEDKIYELFSDTLNKDFPEYIDIYVYSTYDYVDCTKAEYEASWEYKEEYYYEEESDFKRIKVMKGSLQPLGEDVIFNVLEHGSLRTRNPRYK